VSDHFDEILLRRIEDAGLNASAPPQQRWLDGWLVRLSPGKAKRARCINAVAAGVRSIGSKLDECAAVYREADLPMVVRITPFSDPPALDAELARRGFIKEDATCVMVRGELASLAGGPPAGVDGRLDWQPCAPVDYAAIVGAWRGSSAAAIAAHAERMHHTPVPYVAWVCRDADGDVLAGGQMAREGTLVGLYDIFTTPSARGQGLATALCRRLLAQACAEGARAAYLQVDADNAAARTVYHRLGFADAFLYHYRLAPES